LRKKLFGWIQIKFNLFIKSLKFRHTKNTTTKIILCSNCFKDRGLRLDSFNIGVESNEVCPNCKTKNGKKLNSALVERLAVRFFVSGTLHKTFFGGYPAVQFNAFHYSKTCIEISEWLKSDVSLIEDILKIGFFPYGPPLWMAGEVEPLKQLKRNNSTENKTIQRILKEYPEKMFNEVFYRLRVNPKKTSDFTEYDSPPNPPKNKGRLDSENISILYGSQDLEVCIHECRARMEDKLFFATLRPIQKLKLLDLTFSLHDYTDPFESLDIAINMLFSASKYSYKISRKIACAAKKAGFDGIVFPSYFRSILSEIAPFDTGPHPDKGNEPQRVANIALFGKPIENKMVEVVCINRLQLNHVKYDFLFGPSDY
jgi:hypothetical protein